MEKIFAHSYAQLDYTQIGEVSNIFGKIFFGVRQNARMKSPKRTR